MLAASGKCLQLLQILCAEVILLIEVFINRSQLDYSTLASMYMYCASMYMNMCLHVHGHVVTRFMKTALHTDLSGFPSLAVSTASCSLAAIVRTTSCFFVFLRKLEKTAIVPSVTAY